MFSMLSMNDDSSIAFFLPLVLAGGASCRHDVVAIEANPVDGACWLWWLEKRDGCWNAGWASIQSMSFDG
jgi:hypothetical protein